MGYTHYWRQFRPFTKEEWLTITSEAKRICAKAQRGLYSGPEDYKSATQTESHSNCGQIGFAEKTAWRTFDHPECPPPMQGAAIELDNLLISDREIVLNGKPPQDYETFALERTPVCPDYQRDAVAKGEGIFNCCKTEYRAYDPVVVSILEVARTVAPDAIVVTSDGNQEAIRMMF